jgi:hypothetical protein
MREEEDSLAYPYVLVDSMLNSAQQRICSGQIKNTFNGEVITKGTLSFLEERKFYSNILSTSLTADIAALSDVTLATTSTAGYPTTGSLWLQGDIISYTGLTATTFTGVT